MSSTSSGQMAGQSMPSSMRIESWKYSPNNNQEYETVETKCCFCIPQTKRVQRGVSVSMQIDEPKEKQAITQPLLH